MEAPPPEDEADQTEPSTERRFWNWLRTPIKDEPPPPTATTWKPSTPTGRKRLTLKVGEESATAELDSACCCCDTAAAGNEKGDGGGGGDSIAANLLKVAGAIGSGITATGFVVLVGAAVFWIRFDEAGLPAMQAVSVLPKYEALAQGAQECLAFLLVALVAVVLVYFADPGGQVRGITLVALGLLGAIGAIYPFCTELALLCKFALAVLPPLLVWGCVAVGLRTDTRFWPLALAVFVATLAFSATVGILIVKEQRFVQAVAVLRGEGDAGLTGIYVAATDKTIYIGQLTSIPSDKEDDDAGDEGEKRSIFEVPREGAVYAVGPLDSVGHAEERASRMLTQLVANREREAAKPPTSKDSGASGATGPTGAAGATGTGGTTGATGASGDGGSGKKQEAVKGSSVESVAKAFGSGIAIHYKVEEPWNCLVRYASATGRWTGHWWTSCKEDEEKLAGLTVTGIREALALPGRFQPAYDMRVVASLPLDRELVYLEGGVAPQCEHASELPCGHEYRGGSDQADGVTQIYLPEPQQVEVERRECTTARPDSKPEWDENLCFPKKP